MESAIACGRRLEAFGADQPVGRYRLEIDEPPSSVDLMQGSTGVGAFWLRLAHPEIEPDLVLGRIA